MYGFAEDYAASLRRPVTYVPQPIEEWNEQYIQAPLATRIGTHTTDHLKTLTRLVAGGRYDVITDQLAPMLGRPPRRLRWAIEQMAWRFAPPKT
jgi:NAD(P)H dehydrogenase (quinone)